MRRKPVGLSKFREAFWRWPVLGEDFSVLVLKRPFRFNRRTYTAQLLH